MNSAFPSPLLSATDWIWEASWQASLIALVVLIVQAALGRTLTVGWRYGLWLLVIVRLLLPDLPASKTSVYNALPEELRAASFSARPPLGNQSVADGASAPIARPESPASEAPAKNPSFPWRETLAAIWLAGALVGAGRLVISRQRFRRLVRQSGRLPGPALRAQLEEAAATLGTRKPDLLETPAVDSPAVTGLWRPLVLLPAGAEQTFSPAEIRFLLLHELAHVRRGDLWVNALVNLLGVLHWFNPVLWLAFRRIRQDREAACDASVLATQHPSERLPYGEALIKVLESMQTRRRPSTAVGILENHGQLRRRLRQIAAHVRPTRLAVAGGAIVLATLAVTLLTRAEEKSRTPEPPAPIPPAAGTYAERILAAARAGDGAAVERIVLESFDRNADIGTDVAAEMLDALVAAREFAAFSILLGELRKTNLGKDWQPGDELLTGLVQDNRQDFIDLCLREQLDLSRLRKILPAVPAPIREAIAARADAVERERAEIERLIKACAEGNVETVRQLLDAGVSVNGRSSGKDSWTPLTRAASAGKTDVVRLLLERGAQVDLAKHPGWDYTPLCLTSKVEIADLLKAAGADVHAKLFQRDTSILTYVATFNGAPMVQWFLDQGLDPKMIGDNDQTLLFGAKDGDTVEILLKAGVDPNRPDEFGRYAIQECRSAGAARALIKGGAKLTGPKGSLVPGMIQMSSGDAIEAVFETGEIPDAKGLQNALIAACHTDKADLARVLLKYGAKANEPGEWSGPDDTVLPLLVCCIHGSPKTAKVLIEHGADPNAGAIPGQMLKTAIHNQENEVVRILKAAGATGASELTIALATKDEKRIAELLKDAPSFEKDPAFWDGVLPAAAERGDLDTVKVAVSHGAPAAPKDGTSAYYSAAFEGQHEVLAYLLGLPRPESAPDKFSRALWAAVWNCHPYDNQRPAADFEKCIRLLLDAGASPNYRDEGKYSLISSAVFTRNPGGNARVIGMLVSAGADPNPETGKGKRLSDDIAETCKTGGCWVPSEAVLAALKKATGPRKSGE